VEKVMLCPTSIPPEGREEVGVPTVVAFNTFSVSAGLFPGTPLESEIVSVTTKVPAAEGLHGRGSTSRVAHPEGSPVHA
jgi:hypothetical protein